MMTRCGCSMACSGCCHTMTPSFPTGFQTLWLSYRSDPRAAQGQGGSFDSGTPGGVTFPPLVWAPPSSFLFLSHSSPQVCPSPHPALPLHPAHRPAPPLPPPPSPLPLQHHLGEKAPRISGSAATATLCLPCHTPEPALEAVRRSFPPASSLRRLDWRGCPCTAQQVGVVGGVSMAAPGQEPGSSSTP